MDMPLSTKEMRIEDLFCGVMSQETKTPCTKEAFSMISVEEYGAVLCLCEQHAYQVFETGLPVIIQESTVEVSKRYFGVALPPKSDEVG